MRTKWLALATATLAAVALSACGAGKTSGGSTTGANGGGTGANTGSTSGNTITIGTTDQVIALDPAGAYDFGSSFFINNLYQFLMNVPAGGKTPQPDAAQSCSFTKPTEYTCTMKSGLKFSNGDPLTAKDVAFSFTRVVKIADPNGPSSLLANMKSVSAPSDSKVVFTLKNPNDQTWPYILGTAAGPIVDSKVFPADKELPDGQIIGSGPYKLVSFDKNQQANLTANSNYSGPNTPKTQNIIVKTYSESSNLKLNIQSGDIDVAYRTLTPSDIQSLSSDSNVKVIKGAGGELRYIVFNFKTMPGANDAQKEAIRKAMAYSVDRSQLANEIYKGTYQPSYSMVPPGIKGATTPFKDVYGTKPDKAKAQQLLQQAGVKTPVSLNIEYTTDHYGPTSTQEYGAIKQQLEATGLFKVTLGSALYTVYSPARVKDTYPIYQLGWFPDYVNADDYLSPFLVPDNFVSAHYCDAKAPVGSRPCDKDKVAPLLVQEETHTGATADQALAKIQNILATGQMPYLPLLSGYQVAVTGTNISGVQETLDPTYQFRFWMLSKS
ncbi:MAG TPA: ABC transporter substrate-binding protein [Jatrophihabitans sp.]|jgi:peptide/nickel transport system substrate-binding protein